MTGRLLIPWSPVRSGCTVVPAAGPRGGILARQVFGASIACDPCGTGEYQDETGSKSCKRRHWICTN